VLEFRQMPEVLLEMPPVRMMSTNLHTMAIGEDGSLWAFGNNISGQIGDGTTQIWGFFDRVGRSTGWAYVDTGREHTVAIRTDGSLWAWGWYPRTWFTGIGNGTTTGSRNPVRIGRDNDWVTVAAGHMHTLAIRADGSLWAWGNNDHGQLGNGEGGYESTYPLRPIRVGIETDWAYIVATHWESFAIKTNGSLWFWGNNDLGSLGNGTTESKFVPTQIGTDTDWVAIDSDNGRVVALKSDGTIWGWGNRWQFRQSDGSSGHRLVPTQVGTDTDWVSIAAGSGYTLAVKEDGSVWVAGSNYQLRFSPYDRDARVFTQIYEGHHWVNVVAGDNRAFAIRQDGRILRLGHLLDIE